jgi:3-hydroxybutyrate dehydrogenase
MTGRLQNKIALVTGGSRGIGKAIAEAYAREGAKIVLNARQKEQLEETSEEIRQTGTEVFSYAADVSNGESVKALVQAATDHYGQIDILVNNAGIYRPAPFINYTFEDFSTVVQTNLYSVFHMTQAVLPAMIERKKGRIINVASTAGKWGSRNQSAYNASKHAIVGLTRCIGLEVAADGITVNAICPWIVDTDLVDVFMKEHSAINNVPEETLAQFMQNSVPIKRWIRAEEVAHMAVYLGSDEAEYINCQAWTIDGGYTMI